MKITTERLALFNDEKTVHSFYKTEDVLDSNGNIAGTKVILNIKFKNTVHATCKRNCMINAIIIDDERHSCDALKMLLEKCCPQVQVTAICHSGEEGIKKINELNPNLFSLILKCRT